MKRIFRNITNGVIIIVWGILHTQLTLSDNGFGRQFKKFCQKGFYKISGGIDDLPSYSGKINFETFSAFWFFYFGVLLIPLGFLLHYIERKENRVPLGFLISYLFVIIIGVVMIPKSGMTFFMLPHLIFMIIMKFIKYKKSKV